MQSIDDYEVECDYARYGDGGYYVVTVTGPLAMVVAGLFMGVAAKAAMSDTTELYVDKFWELVDVLMNAVCFVLIGFGG
jgi:CPA1 family monovalent cation:H+ antiporter